MTEVLKPEGQVEKLEDVSLIVTSYIDTIFPGCGVFSLPLENQDGSATMYKVKPPYVLGTHRELADHAIRLKAPIGVFCVNHAKDIWGSFPISVGKQGLLQNSSTVELTTTTQESAQFLLKSAALNAFFDVHEIRGPENLGERSRSFMFFSPERGVSSFYTLALCPLCSNFDNATNAPKSICPRTTEPQRKDQFIGCLLTPLFYAPVETATVETAPVETGVGGVQLEPTF